MHKVVLSIIEGMGILYDIIEQSTRWGAAYILWALFINTHWWCWSVYCGKKYTYKLPIFLTFNYHKKMKNGWKIRVRIFQIDFLVIVEIPSIPSYHCRSFRNYWVWNSYPNKLTFNTVTFNTFNVLIHLTV